MSSFEDDVMFCVPRLVSSNTTTTTTTTAPARETSSDATARLEKTDRQSARDVVFAVLALIFFFADADSNRLWERWEKNRKTYISLDGERTKKSDFDFTDNKLFSLSLVCVLSFLKIKG